MSPAPRLETSRACPRCGTSVRTEQTYGASGLTVMWRCDCGWSSVRTVSADAKVLRRDHRSGVYSRSASVPPETARRGSNDDQR